MSAKQESIRMPELLNRAEEVIKKVQEWPEWKKGPIGVALYAQNVRQAGSEKTEKPQNEKAELD